MRFLDSFARDNIGKHLIFDIFIDKIIVFNDKIAATFHYNDDRREMPICDIIEMISLWNPMYLSIRQKETGDRIKKLLKENGYTVKDIQSAMGFENPQETACGGSVFSAATRGIMPLAVFR